MRDIKLKYRRSFLGYLWSVLNPLMTMIVLTIVFSNFFKFSITNFPVYLLSGQVVFGFFSASTNLSCFSIVDNSSLIKKTYVTKYIFVISRVTSGFVDYAFSLVALILVMLITKSQLSVYNLLFIVPSIEIFIFTLGVGLFLAQANVFFRDIQYIYSVFLTALSYLTPLFYPIEILPDFVKACVTKGNPLYLYVVLFRQCVYENVLINWNMALAGLIWAVGAVLVGGFFFIKKQDRFILYI